MIGLKRPRPTPLKIAHKSWLCSWLWLLAPLVSASINLENGPLHGSLTVCPQSAVYPGAANTPPTLAVRREGEGDEPKRAQTAEEKQAAMEEALRQALQRFDGLLLREKELLREQGSASASGGGSGQNGGGSGQNGGTGQENSSPAEDKNAPSPAGTAGTADPADENGEGYPGGPPEDRRQPGPGSQSDRVPEDIPQSGAGDDIVARQIREAAMQEADPQLREKLWDEYRKYKGLKNGTGRKGGEPQQK